MPGNPVRYGASDPSEPVLHDLPPFRYGGELVAVRLEVRRSDDGAWRGRLLFGPADAGTAPATAEIFCAVSEADLWECLHDLREHHYRDLYRSVSE
jgi:hypothetical protein